ncbi:roadblock/LC7 domain-containing protein [Streptomyces sp. NPDC051940]|uniref:roadblock/LC7 domain-containing protein n=1 Tax=Streptomyces sp. NPDC051940 TaxID=3155675 RepID=UPI00343289F3
MDHDALISEMRGLREHVSGITDTAVAAADGVLIAADTAEDKDAERLAALAAAGLGLARTTIAAASRGLVRQTVTTGSLGCAAVYAVGDLAAMIVIGDEGLDLSRLDAESRPALERIGSILTKGE